MLLENDGAGQQQRVFERRFTGTIRDREMQLLVRSEFGEGYVVDRTGDVRAAHDIDRQRAAELLRAADKRLSDGHAGGRRPGHAERSSGWNAVDRERIVRARVALCKGRHARREEGDGGSSQGPSEETHIPNNAGREPIVAIRPMTRADVDAFAGWARHDDPLFRHYNVPLLSRTDADALWSMLTSEPAQRRPFAGLAGDRVVATLMMRKIDLPPGSCELGVMLDPAYLGQGLGKRILRAFMAVLETDGFRRVHLEVAGYNERAIATYRAVGFAACGEHWAEPEPGVDVGALLEGPAAGAIVENVRLDADGTYRARIVRMERDLTPQTKDNFSL